MSFEEMVVALVGAVGGIALVGYIFAKIVDLIKAWINRNNTSITEQDFDRLAKAFMEHKKDTKRRIQNLEAIIADKDISTEQSQTSRQLGASNEQSIEIEDEEQRSEQNRNSNLRNMLHE